MGLCLLRVYVRWLRGEKDWRGGSIEALFPSQGEASAVFSSLISSPELLSLIEALLS